MATPKKQLKDSWEDPNKVSEEAARQLESKRYYEITLPREEAKVRERVKELKEKAADALNEALLVDALLNGNVTVVRKLIEEGLDIKKYDKSESYNFARITPEEYWFADYTPLTAAVRGGNVDCVKEIIRTGVDINAPDGFGSPLSWAVMIGRADIIKVLIEAGADPDRDDSELSDGTPRTIAERCGRKDCIEALATAGTKPRKKEPPAGPSTP